MQTQIPYLDRIEKTIKQLEHNKGKKKNKRKEFKNKVKAQKLKEKLMLARWRHNDY